MNCSKIEFPHDAVGQNEYYYEFYGRWYIIRFPNVDHIFHSVFYAIKNSVIKLRISAIFLLYFCFCF